MAKGGSGKDAEERIDSIDSLRRRVPSIVKRINDDPALALRAAANPLLVLKELGIELTDRLAEEVELRVRFRPEQVSRIQQLRSEIQKYAGESFNVDDAGQLHRVLFDRLKLPALPAPAQPVTIAQSPVAGGYAQADRHRLEHAWAAPGAVRRPDPLESLRGAHPVAGPLLEYRAIQASQPPLASREVVERLTRDGGSLPKLRIRASLRRGATPE